MLYEYYNAVKTLIEAGSDPQPESVSWFNSQYDETIINDRVAYIEFPEQLAPDPVSKDMLRARLTIRVHVVSRVLQKIDAAIPDSEVIQHEALCTSVLDALRGQALTSETGTDITTRLRWCGWQHHHKYMGWMVTWIEFVCNTGAL